jgi:small-conductance mechanosensitive channel
MKNSVSLVAQLLIITIALILVLEITGIGVSVFSAPLFRIKETPITIISLVNLTAIIAVAMFSARILVKILQSQIYQKFEIDVGLQHTISTVVKYVIIGTGIFVALENIGFDLSVITALAAVLMVGIGFGLQNIANNFISGLIILFERPIKVGDFVAIGDILGEVKSISARSTKVTTLDNISVIVPNADFLSNSVTNWSHSELKTRIHINVGVAYGSDTELVRKIMIEIAEKHAKVLKKPAPDVWFREFGDSSLNFSLLIWTTEPHLHDVIRSDLNFAIDKAFREQGVEIPFPQRDLHLRTSIPIPLAESQRR